MPLIFLWSSKCKAYKSNISIYLKSQIIADISSIYPKDTEAPPAGVDDMTKLAYLHEPGVLYNLACRFGLNEIYVSLNFYW